ncbi:CopG family ribbon-helix-helix protein [Pseudaminobacter sp. 19-2017]|uniref:Relaxosome protein TraY n=1 Tax=Pseudaminobacter soli (ex Zhang et al. 2022) TaxID=2831468 RepID=A0A942I375_9HYPH|nr:CopG family ribbon-helix-helix protein [Pseudaminobacter soli]MBS3649893.1 CopG family ribbon-helix-helix protein [Pseudaminobacter soli]
MKPHLSETVTVRLSGETKAKLNALAEHTRRTKSFLAGEAIEDYVERELAIVAGVQRGLDDMEAGRVTSHKDAMRRIKALIESAQKTR